MRKFTQEESAFLRKNVAGRSYVRLTVLFNNRFLPSVTIEVIAGFLRRHKLRNGLNTRFQPGHISHNKGKKGCAPGSEKGWFKPGQMPATFREAGSERINIYGYAEIKVANPKIWKAKHAVIWEAAHGKIPKGHVIIFADGNKENFALDNLLLVSRGELAVMNRMNLISNHGDLTKTGKVVADIKMMISARKKETKKRKTGRGYAKQRNKSQ